MSLIGYPQAPKMVSLPCYVSNCVLTNLKLEQTINSWFAWHAQWYKVSGSFFFYRWPTSGTHRIQLRLYSCLCAVTFSGVGIGRLVQSGTISWFRSVSHWRYILSSLLHLLQLPGPFALFVESETSLLLCSLPLYCFCEHFIVPFIL